MRMLTGKWFLFFCVILVHLISFLIKAQPPYPYYICQNDSGTYTPNSTYSINLETALSSLQETNSGYGYFNASAGQGIDTANAMCLCRGDVDLDMCQSCLRDSIFRLRHTCLNQREAVIYYQFCLLKYSNVAILGSYDMSRDTYYLDNGKYFSDKTESNELLQPFMNKLRGEAAAGSSLLKFAMDNTTGPGNTTLYGLTQCIPTLTEPQCDDCLKIAISGLSTCCDGRVGAIVLMARCNVRYEIYEFDIHPAILPRLPISQSSPPQAGRKERTKPRNQEIKRIVRFGAKSWCLLACSSLTQAQVIEYREEKKPEVLLKTKVRRAIRLGMSMSREGSRMVFLGEWVGFKPI